MREQRVERRGLSAGDVLPFLRERRDVTRLQLRKVCSRGCRAAPAVLISSEREQMLHTQTLPRKLVKLAICIITFSSLTHYLFPAHLFFSSLCTPKVSSPPSPSLFLLLASLPFPCLPCSLSCHLVCSSRRASGGIPPLHTRLICSQYNSHRKNKRSVFCYNRNTLFLKDISVFTSL